MDNQEKKEPISRDEILNKIRDLLGRDGVDSRIVLVGEAGIGKTWLAKEVSKRVTQETSSSYIVLWLHLNKKIRDEKTLYENISAQLSLFFEYEEGENQNEVDVSLETLKKNISNAIIKTKKKNLLLILDDEGSMTTKKHVMDVLYLPQYLQDVVKDITLKVLVTRRGEIQEQESYRTIKVDSLTEDESEKLLRDSQTLLESYTVDDWPDLLKRLYESREIKEPTLMSCIKSKSQGLPAAIVVLSKSLNSINTLSAKQRKIFKELILSSKSLDAAAGSRSLYNPVLRLSYELLKPEEKIEKPVIDCFWHSLDFYKHCGCVYYRDLITQWILEGYFDPVRSVEKAYKDGHKILLELISRGVLKTQEDDMVVPEMAMSFLIDLRHHGLLGRSRLRFARVYGGDKNKGLGKITQIDDMIKTVQGKRGDNNSIRTILVSGNRLRLETPKKFFEEMKDLEVVGLFDPTMEYLIQSLRELKKLRVLVIRDYDLLSSIEELKGGLRRLQVLEVSGASSLVTISDDFFQAVKQLQSLNLSGLGIKSSPSSISQLKNLHSLILRDCSLLEDLPDVQHLKRLEILDVRGACNLITCYRNRTFSRLKQLQLLDLSESKLKRLPIFQDSAVATKLHSLTRLSLRNCCKLVKLPNLRPLSGLQVLDLSGTTSLVEISEVCFEKKEELNILNLSRTKFTKLPSTISGLNSLSQLLIKDNSNLESLPNIKGLTSLQVFDVSGCTNLRKIEGSFEEMCYLREVNLSGTRIETLPELPVKNSHVCSKLLVLADSRSLIRDTWSQVKEAITRNEMSESLSSSGTVSNKELKEAWGFNCPEKKGERWENLYKYIYMNTIPFVDITSHQEVLEVQGSHGIDIKDKEALAKAEFVAFVDNTTASLSRVFNDLKAVKGCWVEMCEDIQQLFFGVDEERLRNLEILSITNLRLMDSICSSSSFKNLKKLNLDCCSSIKTLFPASEPPIFLEVLKIKFCDKLEKVFGKQVEVLSLHTLCLLELPVLSSIGATLPNLVTYKKDKCPNLNISEENLKSS
ncbi:unnamed protein product [Eruca vesicaria subsp. sativa]|uniref:NB-ARC domain-containing protein n=1 Tax=Eruca vesicaria subsp. sativa TaxID=29727 RepID=A0ABC8JZN5_ERUVS|nr:unnamed protein product [Eruca vesicaria subsp. sativa]